MAKSYKFSSAVLRVLIEQYRREYIDACNVQDAKWQSYARQKIKEYSEELPQVELMEKLEKDL